MKRGKGGLRGLLARFPGMEGERGATVVEMALVLPILLLFIMGIIEFGNVFRVMLTLHKATQFGTRMAVTGMGYENGTRMSYIESATKKILEDLPGTPAEVTVSSWGGVTDSGDGREGNPGMPCELVQVKVDYDYTPVTPLAGLLALYGGDFTDKISLSQSDRKVNEPWIPCN